MFSGIVEEAATVKALRTEQGNLHLTLSCSFVNELKIDQSIAHNGVCLTVVSIDGDTYTVLPAAFGQLSQGILNVSKVKTGTVTMSRLVYKDGAYTMQVILGEGKNPPKWEECGWDQPAPQLSALEIEIGDVEKFADNVACQHYIITYGDNRGLIANLCAILGIRVQYVTE